MLKTIFQLNSGCVYFEYSIGLQGSYRVFIRQKSGLVLQIVFSKNYHSEGSIRSVQMRVFILES